MCLSKNLKKQIIKLTAFRLSSADKALWDLCRNKSIIFDTAPLLLALSDPARGLEVTAVCL